MKQLEIYDVKVNGLKNPVGYEFESVICSWKVRGTSGKKQKYARIEVAEDRDFHTIVIVKEGMQRNSLAEPLELKLKPYTRYYFRVTVETDIDETDTCETAVSEVCYFETAKLEEPWKGHWIGMQNDDRFHPVFQKEFPVSGKIKKARLYVSGLGLFEAFVNGKKAGNDVLAPFISDYKEYVQYCTYDILDLIDEKNKIQIYLGNGWYKGRFGFGRPDPEKKFLCIAEIRLEYEDGRVEVIGTDESWRYQRSCFELTDIYDGERQNYLSEEENPWKPAVVDEIEIPLSARYSPPLHEMETLTVKEIIHTPAGETVLDFGQNFAGFIECHLRLPKKTHMKLEFGEILQDGNFYHDNYRTAKSVFEYISDGIDRVIKPHFTFYGFRYVKVSGIGKVTPEDFTGRAVYSEMEQTGEIITGNRKINRLFENTMWGLKSNFLDMPTDCPQRDERLGWTGDAQVFCRTAGYHMDTRAFYQKFLHDLRLDQVKNDGKVPIYLPNNLPGATSSVWSDVAVFMPYMLYEYYGDKHALECNYPMMKDWVDSITREDEKRGARHLWDFGFHFGDWLALDGATEQSNRGRTDSTYIASVYYYASTRYVAEAAKILGRKEEGTYRTLAGKIYQALLDEFYSPGGRLTVDTQTGYILALRFGIYRDKDKMISGLKSRIKNDCYRIKGGFVGATMMNTVLAENGMSGLAYDFLFFEKFPGWLYEVNLGATTIWERWNSVLPDGKISGTGMNSLNHYAYGSVAEFLYRHAAGIIPTEPGFRKVRFEPKPDIRLGRMKCSYESASGRYVSGWEIRQDGSLNIHFEVPFGAAALIVLPDSKHEPIEVTAGQYDFTYMPERDYRVLYGGDTRLELLAEHPEAKKVLETYVPQVIPAVKSGNIEELSKTLNEMQAQAAMIGAPVEQFSKAIIELEKIR